MGINKVQFGNQTLIDLTSDTVTADKLMQGYTAHDRTGALITGTATRGGRIWKDENGYVHLSDDGNLVGVEPLTVTENGTYTAPTGKAYSPITVDVSGGGVPYEPRSDGKSHLWFDVWDSDMPVGVVLPSGTTIVDWGDGTTENYTTNGLKQHAYSKAGIYEVTITNSNYSIGSYQNNGTSVDKCNLIAAELARKPSGSGTFHQCPSLRWVYMSDGASSAGEYSHYSMFYQDMSLAFVRLPNDMVDISGSMFHSCYTLNTISIPSTVTHIYSSAFSDCSSLESITLPEGLLTIDASAFQGCVKLLTLTIPASVTTIGNYAFAYRPNALEYHFLSTTPPTLGSANVFQSIGANCKIYVPSASLEAYQTANNWSTYASYMVGE